MKKKIIVTVILIIFFMPLLFVLLQIINGVFENPSSLEYFITNQFFYKIYNSMILCLGVSLVSLFFALVSTFSFFSINIAWQRQILFLLLFIFFSISPIIYLTALSKLAWFNQLSVYIQSLAVLSIKLFPLATIILLISFRRIESSSIKTALMISPLKNVLIHIILPQLYKPAASAFLIIFMLTFVHEEVPSFLGYRTYAEEFLSRIVIMENIKEISFMTIPFILLTFLVLGVLARTAQSHINDNSNTPSYIFQNFKKPALSVIVILSILVVFMSSLLLKELATIDATTLFIDNFSALKNSLFLSFFTGILGTIFSLYIYSFIHSDSSTNIKIILILPMLLYWLMPSALSSLSLIELSIYLNQYNILIGYALVVFAYLIKVLPIALLFLLSFKVIQPSDIFLKLHNINAINVFKHITIPLAWSKWLVLTIILTIFSLNELSSTVLLIPPGEETIIVKIYNLMHYGDFSSVAFLSLLQMSLILISIFVIGLLLRRQYDYT
jgi:iron(III) transport system permease protein